MASPLLQAALSHYIAERDECLAELDIYINRPVGVSSKPEVTKDVIKLFARLNSSESIIETIREIISGNNQQSSQVEKLKREIEEMSNAIKGEQS